MTQKEQIESLEKYFVNLSLPKRHGCRLGYYTQSGLQSLIKLNFECAKEHESQAMRTGAIRLLTQLKESLSMQGAKYEANQRSPSNSTTPQSQQQSKNLFNETRTS